MAGVVTVPNPDILNELEAAAYLRVSRGTLRRLRRQHLIPHWRLGPQTIRYSRRQLDAWADRGFRAGNPPVQGAEPGGDATGGQTTGDHDAPRAFPSGWKRHG
jgi:excisionase family DNA binding protein